MERLLTKTGVRTFFLFCTLLIACDDTEVPDGAFEPQAKKLEGAYQITKVTRNGNDITERFDFTKFRLTFQTTGEGTGTYALENEAPFLVSKGGTWSFDDPSYPFAIAFTQTGDASLHIAEMPSPIIQENPNLILTFSPGCSANTYQYNLSYVSE